ncbi:MAG: hypothetical protein GY716_21215 [bacterium]|nr:hypothetical protein [bacterium]
MGLSPYIMSREQYEDRCRERLESSLADDPDRVTRALLHRYPATSEQAAGELRTRGSEVSAEALPPFARNLGLDPRVIGRSHVWYSDDIDLLAEALDGANRLTHPATWRRARGVSVAQELAIEREVEVRRQIYLDTVADVVGCESADVLEAVTGILPDPLEWNEEYTDRAVNLTRDFLEGVRS